MTRNRLFKTLGLSVISCALISGAPKFARAQDAETYYIGNIEAIVQAKCIACHVSGGQAGSTSLKFTGSPSSNHAQFESFVNTPSAGFRADTVLTKIRGGAGHGGGVQASEGSSDYQKFSDYMALLSGGGEQGGPEVLRIALEEPIEGESHTGVGNLRGWAVSSDGIQKVEILINGAYIFDAPYGGSRLDVGGAFPEVPNSSDSGFSLAFNYSNLSAGPHTITAIAHSSSGATVEGSASFEVVRFDSSFISDENAVDLSSASCALDTNEISIVDALVEGSLLDLRLKWRKAEQGFEIIEIR